MCGKVDRAVLNNELKKKIKSVTKNCEENDSVAIVNCELTDDVFTT